MVNKFQKNSLLIFLLVGVLFLLVSWGGKNMLRNGEDIIMGQFAFNTSIPSDELESILKKHDLTLVQVNYETGWSHGGYRIREQITDSSVAFMDTINFASENAKGVLKDSEKMLFNPLPGADLGLLEFKINKLKQSIKLLDDGKIDIDGFEGKGKLKDLEYIRDNYDFVAYLKILSRDEIARPILPPK